jgi:hypothetical protein
MIINLMAKSSRSKWLENLKGRKVLNQMINVETAASLVTGRMDVHNIEEGNNWFI